MLLIICSTDVPQLVIFSAWKSQPGERKNSHKGLREAKYFTLEIKKFDRITDRDRRFIRCLLFIYVVFPPRFISGIKAAKYLFVGTFSVTHFFRNYHKFLTTSETSLIIVQKFLLRVLPSGDFWGCCSNGDLCDGYVCPYFGTGISS